MSVRSLAAAIACGLASSLAHAQASPVNTTNLDPATDAPGLRVGDKAPRGMTLRTADNKEVTLESMWADSPVVVTFYRGGWCPYCTKDLAKWEKRVDEIETMGAKFVAVTMEKPDLAQKTGAKHTPGTMILSDSEGDVSRAFRLAFAIDDGTMKTLKRYGVDLEATNASAEWELPAPATFVIDRDGVVRYAWADWDFTKRAPIGEVVDATRAVVATAR